MLDVSNKQDRYHYLIVFLLPIILLCFSLFNGFVYFDDDILILDNQAKIADLTNIGKVFLSDAFLNNTSPYYRPLLNVSLMMDAQVAKTKPGFYHFMNLFYHCLCCMSLLWLLRLLKFNKELALAGSLVFSIHPLLSSAVFWIPARNDILVALFGLLFMSLVIIWIRTKKSWLLPAIILSFAAALFSKESGILLPFLIIVYLILTKQISITPGKIILFLGLVIVVAIWILLRMLTIKVHGSWQLGPSAIVANIPFLFEIIARFFIPFSLAVTPVYTLLYTSFGILILITIILVFAMKKEKVVWQFVFGLIWYISFSLPNMFVRLDVAANSYDYLVHRAYFPLVGLLISILSLIPQHWELLNRKVLQAGFTILMIILLMNSVFLGIKYKDATSFWGSAIAYRPEKAWFHHFLGRYYFKQQDYTSFENHLRKAISLNRHPRFLYNLGMIYFLEKKSYDSAFLLFKEARATGFTDPEANSNYFKLCVESARIFYEEGNYKKAAERCQLAIDLDPSNPVALYNMGLYLIYSNEPKRAATLWRRSLLLDPDLIEAYRSLYFYYLNNTSNRDSINFYAIEYRKRGGLL